MLHCSHTASSWIMLCAKSCGAIVLVNVCACVSSALGQYIICFLFCLYHHLFLLYHCLSVLDTLSWRREVLEFILLLFLSSSPCQPRQGLKALARASAASAVTNIHQLDMKLSDRQFWILLARLSISRSFRSFQNMCADADRAACAQVCFGEAIGGVGAFSVQQQSWPMDPHRL